MKKRLISLCALWLALALSGCERTQDGGTSAAIIYAAAALLSLLLLLGYCVLEKKRDAWFLLLFSSVLVVNIGYFLLSVSRGLDGALLANRVAYLGSVFLPMSMLMIILNVTGLRHKKWLPALLLGLAAVVFLIAASPGYLDIYYKEVTFVTVGGASALEKVYGPLHCVYAVYLVCYFLAMVAVVIHASAAKKLESTGHAVILAIAVLANLGVWFVEQLADFDFEFLSISYIISELFLLGLHLIVAENQRLKHLVTEKEQALSEKAQALTEKEQALNQAAAESSPYAALKAQLTGTAELSEERLRTFAEGLPSLTQTERTIFDAYIARMTTKEIMAELSIRENTLKFHNKNLYHKLGVSSRNELREVYKQLADANM